MVGKKLKRKEKKTNTSIPDTSSSHDMNSSGAQEELLPPRDDANGKSNEPMNFHHGEKITRVIPTPPQVYLPGQDMKQDEVLDFDASAYDMYHDFEVEWPCLSFGFLKDSLGMGRTQFPMTTYLVTGTQADLPQHNKLWAMKWSQLCRTQNMDKEDSDEESDDDDGDEGNEPTLNYEELNLNAAVNRLKVMPCQIGHVVALWLDSGHVSIFDITQMVTHLDDAPKKSNISHRQQPRQQQRQHPLYTFAGHPAEGFALDWSSLVRGRLATGDSEKNIYLWEPHEAGTWTVNSIPFYGHHQSVEDLQWSPTETELLASCSADTTLKLWDVRQKERAAASILAHESDVNVLSWNR
jgi:ribosome assembly protein RRB1